MPAFLFLKSFLFFSKKLLQTCRKIRKGKKAFTKLVGLSEKKSKGEAFSVQGSFFFVSLFIFRIALFEEILFKAGTRDVFPMPAFKRICAKPRDTTDSGSAHPKSITRNDSMVQQGGIRCKSHKRKGREG